MSFSSLGLIPPILQAVADKGYDTPSPIQLKAIPAVLSGSDVMAAAQTGTGKTAGFTLPLLQLLTASADATVQRKKGNQIRALVLTPTRELAAQVGDNIATYGQNLQLKSDIVFGGVKINPQMQRLRGGADILIATPGRLLDLFNQNAIKFDHLEVLILDEADRMLDMGFIHDIKKIIALLPKQRQNLLFSATFSNDIRQLAGRFVHNPIEISVTPPNSTANTVKQWLVPVDKVNKTELLCELIHEEQWQQVLVFSRTKHGANKLVRKLEANGITAAPIHGNKSQAARTRALKDFKAGDVRVLVATDIAARGIDIDQLPQVVNFDLPNVAEDYVHRIGRTGRAGAEGQAVSLVCADEAKELFAIERLIQKVIERRIHPDFDPSHCVPDSNLDTRPTKPKKPKKNRADAATGQKTGNRSGSSSNKSRKPQRRKSDGNSAANSETNGASTGQRKKRRSDGNSNGNRSNRGNSKDSRDNQADGSSNANDKRKNQRRRKPANSNKKPAPRDANGDVNGNLKSHNRPKPKPDVDGNR